MGSTPRLHCRVISKIGDLSLAGKLSWGCDLVSTQPCISLRSLNRVPSSAGVKAGKSPLLDSR